MRYASLLHLELLHQLENDQLGIFFNLFMERICVYGTILNFQPPPPIFPSFAFKQWNFF